MTDNHGDVLSPLPVAPVNETDMVLLPEGRQAFKKVAQQVSLDRRDAYVNLDAGCDSTDHRTCMFNAGMIPNITEHPRNRKRPKRGRKRLFNAAIHALRTRVDRTFAWEDKFKRRLLRFERMQQRHFGMTLMAYTLIGVWVCHSHLPAPGGLRIGTGQIRLANLTPEVQHTHGHDFLSVVFPAAPGQA